MDARHHEPTPWEWPPWDSWGFNEAPGWIPKSRDALNFNAFPTDATAELDEPCYDLTLNGLEPELPFTTPLGHVENIDHLGFEPPFTMGAFSWSRPNGSAWSASSGESIFSSPSAEWEIPYQSLNLLSSQSPLGPLGSAHSTVIGMPQFPVTQPCWENHTNDEASASGAPATLPGVKFQRSPAKATTAPQAHNMKDGPPTLSARQRRYQDRPVKCPECPKSFPYNADCGRHIASRHRHVAHKYHVTTKLYACDRCCKLYTRKDRLLRHSTQEHGRPKTVRCRRSVAER